MASVTLPGMRELLLVVDKAAAPAKDVGIVLMHGASGDHTSGHLPDTAQAFAASGFTTIRYALKTSLKKRAEACRAVVEYGNVQLGIKRWMLAGHSMGARVAVEVAATDPTVLACIFFSYPLHPPGKEAELRDTPLCTLTQPLLFVRGTRDAFSKDAQFDGVRARLASSRVEVHTMDGGDHSLKAPGGKAGAAAALADARAAAVRFACTVADEGPGPANDDRGPDAEAGPVPAGAGLGAAALEDGGNAEAGAAAAHGKAAGGGSKQGSKKGARGAKARDTGSAPAKAQAAPAEAKRGKAARGKEKDPVAKRKAAAEAAGGAAGEDGIAKSKAQRKRPRPEGGAAKQKKKASRAKK